MRLRGRDMEGRERTRDFGSAIREIAHERFDGAMEVIWSIYIYVNLSSDFKGDRLTHVPGLGGLRTLRMEAVSSSFPAKTSPSRPVLSTPRIEPWGGVPRSGDGEFMLAGPPSSSGFWASSPCVVGGVEGGSGCLGLGPPYSGIHSS